MRDGEIREGLICPECKQLFPSVELLKRHFDERHEDRLRRRTLSESAVDTAAVRRAVVWPPQSLGVTEALYVAPVLPRAL